MNISNSQSRIARAYRELATMAVTGSDNPDYFTVNTALGVLQPKWVHMTFDTFQEARTRAIETTGKWEVSFSGDFGQSNDTDVGMGNDAFSIVVHVNGSATLCILARDNDAYLNGIARASARQS